MEGKKPENQTQKRKATNSAKPSIASGGNPFDDDDDDFTQPSSANTASSTQPTHSQSTQATVSAGNPFNDDDDDFTQPSSAKTASSTQPTVSRGRKDKEKIIEEEDEEENTQFFSLPTTQSTASNNPFDGEEVQEPFQEKTPERKPDTTKVKVLPKERNIPKEKIILPFLKEFEKKEEKGISATLISDLKKISTRIDFIVSEVTKTDVIVKEQFGKLSHLLDTAHQFNSQEFHEEFMKLHEEIQQSVDKLYTLENELQTLQSSLESSKVTREKSKGIFQKVFSSKTPPEDADLERSTSSLSKISTLQNAVKKVYRQNRDSCQTILDGKIEKEIEEEKIRLTKERKEREKASLKDLLQEANALVEAATQNTRNIVTLFTSAGDVDQNDYNLLFDNPNEESLTKLGIDVLESNYILLFTREEYKENYINHSKSILNKFVTQQKKLLEKACPGYEKQLGQEFIGAHQVLQLIISFHKQIRSYLETQWKIVRENRGYQNIQKEIKTLSEFPWSKEGLENAIQAFNEKALALNTLINKAKIGSDFDEAIKASLETKLMNICEKQLVLQFEKLLDNLEKDTLITASQTKRNMSSPNIREVIQEEILGKIEKNRKELNTLINKLLLPEHQLIALREKTERIITSKYQKVGPKLDEVRRKQTEKTISGLEEGESILLIKNLNNSLFDLLTSSITKEEYEDKLARFNSILETLKRTASLTDPMIDDKENLEMLKRIFISNDKNKPTLLQQVFRPKANRLAKIDNLQDFQTALTDIASNIQTTADLFYKEEESSQQPRILPLIQSVDSQKQENDRTKIHLLIGKLIDFRYEKIDEFELDKKHNQILKLIEKLKNQDFYKHKYETLYKKFVEICFPQTKDKFTPPQAREAFMDLLKRNLKSISTIRQMEIYSRRAENEKLLAEQRKQEELLAKQREEEELRRKEEERLLIEEREREELRRREEEERQRILAEEREREELRRREEEERQRILAEEQAVKEANTIKYSDEAWDKLSRAEQADYLKTIDLSRVNRRETILHLLKHFHLFSQTSENDDRNDFNLIEQNKGILSRKLNNSKEEFDIILKVETIIQEREAEQIPLESLEEKAARKKNEQERAQRKREEIKKRLETLKAEKTTETLEKPSLPLDPKPQKKEPGLIRKFMGAFTKRFRNRETEGTTETPEKPSLPLDPKPPKEDKREIERKITRQILADRKLLALLGSREKLFGNSEDEKELLEDLSLSELFDESKNEKNLSKKAKGKENILDNDSEGDSSNTSFDDSERLFKDILQYSDAEWEILPREEKLNFFSELKTSSIMQYSAFDVLSLLRRLHIFLEENKFSPNFKYSDDSDQIEIAKIKKQEIIGQMPAESQDDWNDLANNISKNFEVIEELVLPYTDEEWENLSSEEKFDFFSQLEDNLIVDNVPFYYSSTILTLLQRLFKFLRINIETNKEFDSTSDEVKVRKITEMGEAISQKLTSKQKEKWDTLRDECNTQIDTLRREKLERLEKERQALEDEQKQIDEEKLREKGKETEDNKEREEKSGQFQETTDKEKEKMSKHSLINQAISMINERAQNGKGALIINFSDQSVLFFAGLYAEWLKKEGVIISYDIPHQPEISDENKEAVKGLFATFISTNRETIRQSAFYKIGQAKCDALLDAWELKNLGKTRAVASQLGKGIYGTGTSSTSSTSTSSDKDEEETEEKKGKGPAPSSSD